MQKTAILASILCAFAATSASAQDGTFRGVSMGHNDEITVDVTIKDSKIADVKVVKHYETGAVSELPMRVIPEMIVKNQTLKVDGVTGATFSSMGLMSAVRNAIKAAGLNPADFNKGERVKYQISVPTEPKADVVVIGGGGAGLSAAVAAARAGSKVVLIEKMSFLGGNTTLAGGGYNASHPELSSQQPMSVGQRKMVDALLAEPAKNPLHAELLKKTKAQWDAWIAKTPDKLFDSPELHALQTWKAGDFLGDLNLVYKLATIAPAQLKNLEDMGMKWNPYTSEYVGALWPRSHDASNFKSGQGYILTFRDTIKKENLPVEILLQTKAEKLIKENGRVVGVEATGPNGEKVTARASKGVIITSGGFCANVDMRMKYDKIWDGKLGPKVKSTNSPAITGDGIRMAEAAGAQLVDMGMIQLLPVTDPDTGSNNTAVGQGTSMYVNQEGERFVNETGRRDVVSKMALAQPGGYFYRITTVKNARVGKDGITVLGLNINTLLKTGKVVKADTVEELAKKTGMDPVKFKRTVDRWNDFCRKQTVDPDFGRPSCLDNVTLYEGPYYAEKRAPGVHHSMGGIKIDTQTRVIGTDGKPIPGLFAAGEVTGGIHGTNRIGANAIPDAISFGHLAGTTAANMK